MVTWFSMSFSSGNKTRFLSLLVLGLALVTFLTHTAVFFCLHADGSFGLKMADLGASSSAVFQTANNCIDIPLSFGHTFTEMVSIHSVLSSFNFLSFFLSALLTFSVLSYVSFRPQAFIAFRSKTFPSFKTQTERALQTTVLLQ